MSRLRWEAESAGGNEPRTSMAEATQAFESEKWPRRLDKKAPCQEHRAGFKRQAATWKGVSEVYSYIIPGIWTCKKGQVFTVLHSTEHLEVKT